MKTELKTCRREKYISKKHTRSFISKHRSVFISNLRFAFSEYVNIYLVFLERRTAYTQRSIVIEAIVQIK